MTQASITMLVDLEDMDRVEFYRDFTEVDGRITWWQTYYEKNGNAFDSKCVVTLENDKIVEWVFSNPNP